MTLLLQNLDGTTNSFIVKECSTAQHQPAHDSRDSFDSTESEPAAQTKASSLRCILLRNLYPSLGPIDEHRDLLMLMKVSSVAPV